MQPGRLLDFLLACCVSTALTLSCVVGFGANGTLQIFGVPLGDACPFHRFTQMQCPFCGLSRSMVAMMDGDIGKSFAYHPLSLCIAVLFFGFIAAVCAAAYRHTTPVIETRVFYIVLISLVIMSLTIWVARSLTTF